MSRFRDEDLAYGDLPQRWDRARFERFGRGGGNVEEDDFRFVERDGPGRRDISVAVRERSRGPGGRFEERDRFVEDDRFNPRRRRRTDKELFGDIDPKELVSGALMPYRRPREEIDIEERRSSVVRPGIVRRQSSLDTFDRKPRFDEPRMPPYTPIPLPVRRRREEYYEPEDYREVEIQRERSIHRRGGRPPKSEAGASVTEEVKSVSKHESSSSSSSSVHEVEKEETVRESRAPTTVSRARSRAPTVHESIHEKSIHEDIRGGSRAPTVHESIHEASIHEDIRAPTTVSKARSKRAASVHESLHETQVREEFREPSVKESAIIEESVREERTWKKGKTKMPKRMVVREAIMDFGYPFHEDEDFFFLHCALEKESIDEVIATSNMYKKGEKTYRAEEKVVENVEESESIPRPPLGEHEEIRRREWINPPTVIAEQLERRGSPSAKSSISRRMSRSRSRRPSSPTFVEERKTVVDERSRAGSRADEVFEERKTMVEERAPSHHHHHHRHHDGALIIRDREIRTDRDINAEIRNLEAERRALRLEREADEKHALAERIRHNDELQLVEYRSPRRRSRADVFEIVERERTPERKVIRVEKDRKEREKRTNAKLLGAALATLT